MMGIEPTYLAWKASVLPLNYTRIYVNPFGLLSLSFRNNEYFTTGLLKSQALFLSFFKNFANCFYTVIAKAQAPDNSEVLPGSFHRFGTLSDY